jgi:hypothetical protein
VFLSSHSSHSQSHFTTGTRDLKHELIEAIFKTLTVALEKNSVNKHYFLNEVRSCYTLQLNLLQQDLTEIVVYRHNFLNPILTMFQVGYSILASSLKVGNLLQTAYAQGILNHLFAMATETFGRELDFDAVSQQFIVNAHVINVIVMLIAPTPSAIQVPVFERIHELVKKESNAQNLSNVGLVATITTHYKTQLSNPSDPLHEILFRLVKIVASYRVTAAELRAILRLRDVTPEGAPVHGHDDQIPPRNLASLVEMVDLSALTHDAPFLEFNLGKGGIG